MAQDNGPHIPEQISWTAEPKKKWKAVRSVQQIEAQQPVDLFGAPTGFSKNVQSHGPDLGGAIEINFGKPAFEGSGGKNAQKSSTYTAQIIEVEVIEGLNEKALEDVAPVYDGFQPNYAHYSALDPYKMKGCLEVILKALEQEGMVDFYAISPFTYCGRSFGSRDDCEFRLSIFSGDSTQQSVVELRRSAGECFIYSNVETRILGTLLKQNAIDQLEKEEKEDQDPEEEEDLSDDESGFAFGFGFDSLPSLDSMELDSSFSEEDDGKQQKAPSDKVVDSAMAESILKDAVDQDSMRDVWRSDIAFLNDSIPKHEEVFRHIPHIIETVTNAISQNVYDCWAIKTYLAIISKLVAGQASVPRHLDQAIEEVQLRWSHMVVNDVAPGVQFKFAPSQQIVRCCKQLRGLLKQ